jgi:hypothetical protein
MEAGKDLVEQLQARVAALEETLERRSRELRLIQQSVCARDLVSISRILAGLPPLSRSTYEPGLWRETTELTEADVEETLEDLWSSLTSREAGTSP